MEWARAGTVAPVAVAFIGSFLWDS